MKINVHMVLNYCLGAFLLMELCSCKTQNLLEGRSSSFRADSCFLSSGSGYEYRIRTGDKVSISLWNHDDLSVGSLYGIYNSNEVYGKWLMVNARGEINVPKAGAVSMRGLTILEAEDTLRKVFATWIRNPVVDVKILNKEVTMLGEWKSPGRLSLDKDDNSLVELIGRAGDFDFYADKRRVRIIRMINQQPKVLDVDLTRLDRYYAANINIIPGDVIYAPSRRSKDFEKRLSVVLPFVSIVTAFAIVYKAFL